MKAFRNSLVLIATLAACTTRDVDNPRVELTDVGFVLHLPPAMQQALDSLAPGFRGTSVVVPVGRQPGGGVRKPGQSASRLRGGGRLRP